MQLRWPGTFPVHKLPRWFVSANRQIKRTGVVSFVAGERTDLIGFARFLNGQYITTQRAKFFDDRLAVS
jgi:hypothetical protein